MIMVNPLDSIDFTDAAILEEILVGLPGASDAVGPPAYHLSFMPIEICAIIGGYAPGIEQRNIIKSRTLWDSIARIFLSVVTFGLWNYVQTDRFWKAVATLHAQTGPLCFRNREAYSSMCKALYRGADLSPVLRINFTHLAQYEDASLLRFFAAQISTDNREEDLIFQNFCYSMTLQNEQEVVDKLSQIIERTMGQVDEEEKRKAADKFLRKRERAGFSERV
jgi:hypothetical protein